MNRNDFQRAEWFKRWLAYLRCELEPGDAWPSMVRELYDRDRHEKLRTAYLWLAKRAAERSPGKVVTFKQRMAK